MASITRTLPIELITAIVKSLAGPILERDIDNSGYSAALNDLKACSLACRLFLPLCQKCIFNTINLATHYRVNDRYFSSPRSSMGRFSEIVEMSPILGSYVDRVDLWITGSSIPPSLTQQYPPDIVVSGLRSLTNLKTIAIGSDNEKIPINWSVVPYSLKTEICRLFQLPTITTIELLMTHNFNIHSLAPCGGLETLTFHDSSFDPFAFETTPATASVKPVQPIELNIPGNSQGHTLLSKIMSLKFSDRNLRVFDFGRLETFLIAVNSMDDLRATSDFLQQVNSPFLKKIDICFAKEIDGDAIAASSLNSAMKVVKNLVIWLTCPASGINDQLAGSCRFLQNLSSNNRIQSINICMDYLSSTSHFWDDPNWDLFNDVLLDSGWSSLTKVNLQIRSYTDQESLPQAITRAEVFKKLPQTRLKGLSSSKSFKFLQSLESFVDDPRGFQYSANL